MNMNNAITDLIYIYIYNFVLFFGFFFKIINHYSKAMLDCQFIRVAYGTKVYFFFFSLKNNKAYIM